MGRARSLVMGVMVALCCMLAATAPDVVAVALAAPSAATTDAGSTELEIATLDELDGKKVGVISGGVADKLVTDNLDGTYDFRYFNSPADAIAALRAGKVDGYCSDKPVCQLAVSRYDGIGIVPEPITESDYGLFFREGSPLAGQFSEVIERMQADGTLDALKAKWCGADEDAKTMPDQAWDAPNGTLVMATSGTQEPLTYVRGSDIVGYDIEVAALCCKELGYRLETQSQNIAGALAAVAAGKADLGGGGISITEEREESVDFTVPDYDGALMLVVRTKDGSKGSAGDAAGAAGAADTEAESPGLENSTLKELDGKTIAVPNGGIYDQLFEENLDGTYEFKYFNNISDMVAALKAGKVDAFIHDEPVAALACNHNDGIGIIPELVTEDKYGLFFQKGSELTDKFSEIIETLREDGTLDALKEKWCGADDEAKVLPDQDWDTPNGTLMMLTSAQQEPLTYVSGKEVVGYDIEVALLCCKELGYGLETDTGDISAVIAGVISGKGDFGGGGISITEERKESVDFTVPDYDGALVAVSRTVDDGSSSYDRILRSLISSFKKTFIDEDRWLLFAAGLVTTIVVSVFAGALGTLLGFASVLARRSGVRWVGKVVDAYQALMGGIPLVVVLMVLYYVVFGAIDIAGEVVSIIAFSLAFGATSGATMWTAVKSIDGIQEETGLALGYNRKQVFRKIIFPQARQQFTPQLMGQFVSLVKETSIVGYIAVQDLTRASDLIRARTMDAFFPLISTAIIYFLFCRLLSRGLRLIADRLDVTNRPRKIEGVTE